MNTRECVYIADLTSNCIYVFKVCVKASRTSHIIIRTSKLQGYKQKNIKYLKSFIIINQI